MDMSSTTSIEPIRKVVLAVDLSDASWRDFLMGFFDYAKRNTHWFMRVVQSNEELEKSVAESHGVVIGIQNPGRVISACARHKVPFAVVASESLPPPGTGVPSACVRNDNEGIGRFCAECFMSLGRFAAAAFVSSRAGDDWSAARERGFLGNFLDVSRHTFRTKTEPGSDDDIKALSEWLAALPKPVAVMAAWDIRGMHVLNACRVAGIDVPRQVAVIGVGDDRLFCDFSTPPLTSITPDHVLEGQLAAKTIDKMMRGKCGMKPRLVLNTAKRLVERESTRPLAPATTLVERALSFIADNASRNIKAGDVASALGVSRSLLDLRFKELRGETLAHAIASGRLGEVKRLLAGTGLSIRAITSTCGFANPNHLKNLFRRKFGISMREWRNEHKAQSGPTTARSFNV